MLRKYEQLDKKIAYRIRTFVLFGHFVVNRGFTLIEALVAAGVFAVSMTSIVGIYFSLQRINQKSAAIQAIGQNVRFIHEDLAKLIANGSVDYGRYPGNRVPPQPGATELLLRDNDDVPVRIYRTGDTLNIERGPAGSRVSSAFSGADVRILDFRVYITPRQTQYPLAGGGPREQPTVGVFVDMDTPLGSRERVRERFQTTMATREYPE